MKKQLKIFLSLIISLILLSPAQAGEVYLNSLFEIENVYIVQGKDPEEIKLSFELLNSTGQELKDLLVGLKANSDQGLIVEEAYQKADLEDGEKVLFSFNITKAEDLEEGQCPLGISIKIGESEFLEEFLVSITGGSPTAEPLPPGQSPQAPPALSPAEIQKLLKQLGQADDNLGKTQGENPQTSQVNTDLTDLNPGSIPMGEPTFSNQPMPSIASIPPSAGAGDFQSMAQDFPDPGLTSLGGVDSGNSNVKNKPKVIIDRYTVSPEVPYAGEDFNLYLRFNNTNKDKRVRNIKVTLSSSDTPNLAGDPTAMAQMSPAGSIFTPVESSNTFYISEIYANSTAEKNIALTTPRTLPAKNYELSAIVEYEDMDGNQFVAQETIGIPIVQETRLETSQIQIPQTAFVGEAVDGTLEFYNTGKDTIYNVRVRLEGDFDSEYSEYYAGNMQSGASDSFPIDLTPVKPGSQKGKVVFTYEDSTGAVQSLERDFTIEVDEGIGEEELYGPNGEIIDPQTGELLDPETGLPINQGSGGPNFLLIGLGALILVAIFAYLIKKKRNSEKEEELKINED